MAYTTQYIGSRYVPLFAEPTEWNSARTYEPLTIVMHDGNSYTSRQYVPVGIEITNEKFWALTGNYNAQVEQYRREVNTYITKTDENSNAIAEEKTNREQADTTINNSINEEKTNREQADTTIINSINEEKTNREQADTTINNSINTLKADISTLQKIKQPRKFSTTTEMQNSDNLMLGDICETEGFYVSNDYGGATYIISSGLTANGFDIIQCKNNLQATLVIQAELNVKCIGVEANNSNNDIAARNNDAIDRALSINNNIYIPKGTYYFSNVINIKADTTIHSDNAVLMPSTIGSYDCFSLEGISIANESPTFRIFYGNLSIANYRYGIVINENLEQPTDTVMGVIKDISFLNNVEHIRCHATNVYNLTIENCTFGKCTYGFRWYAPDNLPHNAGEKIIFKNIFSGNCDAIFKLESTMEMWVINSSLDYSACAFYVTAPNVAIWCSECHIEGIGNTDRGSSTAYHGFYYNDHGTTGIIHLNKCLLYQKNDSKFINNAYNNIYFDDCYIGGGYNTEDSSNMYLIDNCVPYVKNTMLANNLSKLPAPKIVNPINPDIVTKNITKHVIQENGYYWGGTGSENIVVSTDASDVFLPAIHNASLVFTNNSNSAIDKLFFTFTGSTTIVQKIMGLIALKYPTDVTAKIKVCSQTGADTSTEGFYTFDRNNTRDGWIVNYNGTTFGLVPSKYFHLAIILEFDNVPANGVIKIGNYMFAAC